MRRTLRSLAVLVAFLPLLALAPVSAEAATPLLVTRLRNLGDARQVVSVTNASWSSSYATLQAFEKSPSGSWRRVFGPWTARIGRNGFGQAKREGDGQSPVGSFRVPGMFGVAANPGTHYRWLRVDRNDVWVDDSRSAFYNLHMRLPVNGRWRSAESMYQPRAYAYAAVIGYNTGLRRPGYGSAIFLHATTGSATAGCVSLPASQLVPLLRWLEWSKRARVVMGPESAVTY
jgi:L,D-peptidoglycan transpeptidase YkuD (ErfK/YbiS/YcfS/YnhG family)